MPYQPHIDGLRAIAVLLVVAFHLEVPPFSGGFVGVDVFFVVSGFLITRMIVSEVGEERFSFARFYTRRVGRLFPALWTTIALTFAFACWRFSPDHLERLAGSSIHALLCLANVFFLAESGYFDASADVKPLLHFWSLSVEEQFYFVWPAALVMLLALIRDRRLIAALVGAIALVSLYAANELVSTEAAFYIMPFRIAEFMVGACLVRLPSLPSSWADLSGLAGISLIVGSALGFDGETVFPGWNALIPSVGAALVIVAGEGHVVGPGLSLAPVVHVGRISYSLYLCHWPIYVFTKYESSGETLGGGVTLAVFAAAWGSAELMYRFVETPLRTRSKRAAEAGQGAAFALVCAMAALVSTFPIAHAWANGGWPWRFGSWNEAMVQLRDLDVLQAQTVRFFEERVTQSDFDTIGLRRVLLVGDSHMKDVSNGFVQVLDADRYEVRGFELNDHCLRFLPEGGKATLESPDDMPDECTRAIDRYRRSKNVLTADVLVFSANFNHETAPFVRRWIQFSRAISRRTNQKIVIMDRSVDYDDFHVKALRLLADGKTVVDVNRRSSEATMYKYRERVGKILRDELKGVDGVVVVRKYDAICDEERCRFFLEDGSLAVWDRAHWTLAGASAFVATLLELYPDMLD